MANNQVVFKYLNSKNVYLDEKEFDFQFDSHPDKTSMLVLSDTLSFFNISNGAIGVGFDKIDNLPDSFMVKLNDNEKGLNYLAFVEKKSGKYELFDELTKSGVIADWREPNVIRIAPAPLYNSYEDCFRFGELLENAIQ